MSWKLTRASARTLGVRSAPAAGITIASLMIATLATAALTAEPATAAPGTAQAGSLIGRVTAPAGPTDSMKPVAGAAVTATAGGGTGYTTITTANGYYDLERLPAPATYSITFADSASPTAMTSAQGSASVPAGSVATADGQLSGAVATVTGVVLGRHDRPVAGIPIALSPTAATCTGGDLCGVQTTSDPRGRYTLHLAAGDYQLQAQDAGRVIDLRTVTAAAGATTRAPAPLGSAPVPAGTSPRHAARDLRWLDAERAAAGLPAHVTLSQRWSAECAAHDAYEVDNNVLSSTENPVAEGASTGGAWAALNAVLAQSSWTRSSNPWVDAPIHLLALFSPSLSVVGIDDGGGHQCVTTDPGLLRTAGSADVVTTYPAAGAHGVPPSEKAAEAPFVPGQFVGIPSGSTTGRDLFVYLNLAHQVGQAPVQIISARLRTDGHPVVVRSVDGSTQTIGEYLTGAILIPVKPLQAGARYKATVQVEDRSGILTHSWSFTTA